MVSTMWTRHMQMADKSTRVVNVHIMFLLDDCGKLESYCELA
jgi:hypothetical protein